jgi:hypothetical protein
MSIFDKLKKASGSAVKNAAPAIKNALSSKKETFTFTALPESLSQMQALPEASLDTPFKTAALTVCALCAYGADKNIGKEMLDWLRGPRPLSPMDISFLNDRFRDGKAYVPFSYFKGARPENDYTMKGSFLSFPFPVPISLEKRKGKGKIKKKWKKICAFKVISDAKKTSFHLSMKQGLFNFYYSKYLISRIKIFTSDGINQICENIV